MDDNKALTVAQPTAITDSPDVLALVADWHQALALQVAAGEIAPLTEGAYRRGFGKFLTWCDATGAGLVTSDTIRQWKADLLADGRRPNTVNAWLAGVRAFFSWGMGARRLAFNPTEGIKSVKRNGTHKRHLRDMLTNGEVTRVLAKPDTSTAAGKRDLAILALMAYTAVRTIEVHRADLGDLQTINDRLVLNVQGKGSTEKDEVVVVAHPDAEAAVYDWLAVRGNKPGPLFESMSNRNLGGRLSLASIRTLVKRYYRAAGVRGDSKTTHSLRHSAISNAVRHGAPIHKVQSMARHTNIQTTTTYFHETDRIDNPAEGYIDYGEGAAQ